MKKLLVVLFVCVAAGVFAQQNTIPEGFVRINGGTFIMGSPASETGRDDDEIQHRVTVSAFYMGRYEVAQADYEEVMGTNPSETKGFNLPVTNVSWFDAIEYCNRLSQRERLTPAYTISGSGNNRTVEWNRNANGYRLPTEAEWEYACRAGTTTAYNTGAAINNNTGWHWANSGRRMHPVGEKPANAWGLHDMHGNVQEWCWDWYGEYGTTNQTDPVGVTSGASRVRRGGSYLDNGQRLRSAWRSISITPDSRVIDIGFRLVRP
jgi:formylglycine-generating enzyme required for sulfatase activity